MLPELSGKTAPALYLKLKNQRYMKAIQLFMFSLSALMTFTLFIGAFFNPSYRRSITKVNSQMVRFAICEPQTLADTRS